MANGALKWDQAGERLYQTGDKNMALYVFNSTTKTIGSHTTNYYAGVAWNGITAITESPSGAEPTDLWADDTKYATMRSAEQFGGTIEAYTYPDEWEACDGSITTNGVTVGQQARKAFGLSYRTLIGNEIKGNELGYKLHLLYNATAAPSEKSYNTVNDSPETSPLSYELTTTPITAPGFKNTALITIDSTKVDATHLKALEDILYGVGEGQNVKARLPKPSEVFTTLGLTQGQDGTWSV